MERIDDDEADVAIAIGRTMRGIAETVLHDQGQAERGVHAKSHGIVIGELRVHEGLPPALAQGLFAKAATYSVVMRLSTIPGDVLDDRVSVPRGLAIKVVGVPGERLPGSEGDVTQDFLMVDAPTFGQATPREFLQGLKGLAATTDKVPALKRGLSTFLRGAEKTLEAVGLESALLKTLGGHPNTHILGETFYTQLPLLYGRHIAKLSLAPVSDHLLALKGVTLDAFEANGSPNPLRDAVIDHFQHHGGQWELRAQLCTNLQGMPIEDGSVTWSESESPYVTVATLDAGLQDVWSNGRVAQVDLGMSFSPWHGLAAHRPLGALNRVRKPAYEMSAKYRAQANGQVIREPRSRDDLPA
ncbi:MAG TPA: catalase family protein [Candidatus Aquabacterium excrementipullorum]|nr:catalase family protein [Candidatus Aquabacterium excrementipullorum]